MIKRLYTHFTITFYENMLRIFLFTFLDILNFRIEALTPNALKANAKDLPNIIKFN